MMNGPRIMRVMKYLINRRTPGDPRLDISPIRTSAPRYWNSADDFLQNLYERRNEPILVRISGWVCEICDSFKTTKLNVWENTVGLFWRLHLKITELRRLLNYVEQIYQLSYDLSTTDERYDIVLDLFQALVTKYYLLRHFLNYC